MVYLDYAATTRPLEGVMESMTETSLNYFANSNSIHKLGYQTKLLEDSCVNNVKDLLKLNDVEVIFTSGATESNNLAIFGVTSLYKNRGNKIITTHHEHSSISNVLSNLESLGFEICYAKLNDDYTVNLDEFKKLLDDNTILVSMASVTSELGVIEPIDEISKIVSKYPKCFLHVDHTQGIGKVNINLNNIDFITMSGHKIYGPKGVGVLIKKKNIVIKPMMLGGASTTNYRAGTPATPLMVGFTKALRYIIDSESTDDKKAYLLDKLDKSIIINSKNSSVSNIINMSVLGVKPETLIHMLEEKEIYVSTKTACSSSNSYSNLLYLLTDDLKVSSSSIRVSLSKYTTYEEIDIFINEINNIVSNLK